MLKTFVDVTFPEKESKKVYQIIKIIPKKDKEFIVNFTHLFHNGDNEGNLLILSRSG